MILSFAFLVPTLIISFYAYRRYRPVVEIERKGALLRYDRGAMFLILFICIALAWTIRSGMAESEDRAWWPVLAALACMGVVPMILFFAGLFRNAAFFKKRSPQ